ncbi:MAG: hypothetical protein HY328_14265 [Chloroflexi bacterium]|nr:hypothetical protein [Chloroflexota bacterium]
MKGLRIFGLLILLAAVFATATYGASGPTNLAVESALAPALQTQEEAERLEFTFVVVNKSETYAGHQLVMSGKGTFDPNNIEDADGSGVYVVSDASSPQSPKPIVNIGAGTWRVKKGVEFTAGPTYGAATGGIADLLIELLPVGGDPIEAILRVVCNLPAVPYATGSPEGIVLTVPDVDTFTPITSETPGVPPFGITIISMLSVGEDDGEMEEAAPAMQMYDGADRLEFTFMVGNKSENVAGDQLVMSGRGSFDPYNLADAEGEGVFYQLDNDSEDRPKPLSGIGMGTWHVKEGIGFSSIGAYGVATAGVVDLLIELHPVDGDPIEATLRVVCNVPPAALFTGLPEGIVLTIPDVDTFTPKVSDTPGVPPLGITLISWVSELEPAPTPAWGIMRYDVAADLDTFDAMREVADGDVFPTGPFYLEGNIYPNGTLDADGVAPDDAEPIGIFRCWGWQYDGSAEGDAVVQQIYELDGLGEIHLQGRDSQPKAVIGGTGIFRDVSGVALRRDINPDNVTFHAVFDFR